LLDSIVTLAGLLADIPRVVDWLGMETTRTGRALTPGAATFAVTLPGARRARYGVVTTPGTYPRCPHRVAR